MRIVGNEIHTLTPEESFAVGAQLGALLQGGDCVCLTGELGAGKTLFTKGIGKGLPSSENPVSPTFNLLLEYPGRVLLHHLDAYFSDRAKALLHESQSDVFSPSSVAVVEWSERVEEFLPKDRISIQIEILGEQERKLRLFAGGTRSQTLMTELLRSVARA